ncbi:MAG: type III-B CRISPR module RAMP protein Cmr4 [Desulfomonilia bacterium]
MFKKEHIDLLKLYAVSPLHAGSGSSTGAVDLPIQRERHTNWPHIQASGVKGALRAHFREMVDEKYPPDSINKTEQLIFGTEDYQIEENGVKKKESCPGAIAVSDAKLIAFPMRSNIAPFVWVTSPAVLTRIDLDLVMMGREGIKDLSMFNIDNDQAICLAGDITGNVLLEDAVVRVVNSAPIDFFKMNFSELDRLVLISDTMYDYCVSTCTEVQTQIKIDETTGTAEPGALRYEELLPADAVLYSVIAFSKAGLANELQVDAVQKTFKNTIKDFLQIGGDATLGRGICKIDWMGGIQ